MSQSATPATQNDMTTCLETFEKERFAASPIDTATPQENQTLETRHVGAAKRAFRARLPLSLTFSTRYQTGWNVTKCHAWHAKRHDNLLGNLRKKEVLQLPPKTRRCHRKTRDSRRDTWEQQNHHFVRGFPQFSQFETCRKDMFCSPIDTAKPPENQWPDTRQVGALKRAFRARLPPIFTLCSFKINVFLRVFVGTSKFCNIKIDASCEASINFQHMSQNATPATEFAPCRHLTQPCQCDLQKTRDETRIKFCACHAKWRWTRPKCCACQRKLPRIFWKRRKVWRLPHKTTFHTLQNTSECHKVPRLPRETKQRDVWNRQKWHLLQNLP